MRPLRYSLYAALLLLYLLHNDWWLRDNADLYLGLPAGLAYHALYCLATVALMAALTRYAWPFDREPGNGPEDEA